MKNESRSEKVSKKFNNKGYELIFTKSPKVCFGAQAHYTIKIERVYLDALWWLSYWVEENTTSNEDNIKALISAFFNESPYNKRRPIVKKDKEGVNNIFLYATNFILYHEVAHHKLGHAKERYQNPLKIEFDADKFAFDKLLELEGNSKSNHLCLGILVGIFATLFIEPTNHICERCKRTKRLLNDLTIDENNDVFWKKAFKLLNLWLSLNRSGTEVGVSENDL